MASNPKSVFMATFEEMQNMLIVAVDQALKKYRLGEVVRVDTKKKFLTPKDVETEYGFKQKLLSYWRLENMGPPYSSHGKRVFYEREALDKYIKQHSLTPTRVPV